MRYLSYTIFSDVACAVVRDIVHAEGDKAYCLMQAFRDIAKCEPKEKMIIAGCRIDRIGSEEHTED